MRTEGSAGLKIVNQGIKVISILLLGFSPLCVDKVCEATAHQLRRKHELMSIS